MNHDSLETRPFGVDAGDVGKHPLADGAKRVVGERIHARVAESLLLCEAVPAFPYCRRALIDFVAP